MIPLTAPAEQLPGDRPLFIYGAGAAGRLCRMAFDAAHGRPAAGFIDSVRDGAVDGLPLRSLNNFIVAWRSGELGRPAVAICSQSAPAMAEALAAAGFDGPTFDGQAYYLANLAHLPPRSNVTVMALDAAYDHPPRHGYGRPDHPGLRRLLEEGHSRYADFLQKIENCIPGLSAVPEETDRPDAPRWRNGFLSALDGMSVYAMIAALRPRRFIEVGSGNSTMFARQAIRDYGLPTRIRSIDPYPRAEIDAICDETIRAPLESALDAAFGDVGVEDLVFVDSSHRAFQGSDVTVFMTEALPALPKGLVVGVHDIFFPEDYPPDWRARYYNEQYLLACWLLAAPQRLITLFPAWHVGRRPEFADTLRRLYDAAGAPAAAREGCGFWFQIG